MDFVMFLWFVVAAAAGFFAGYMRGFAAAEDEWRPNYNRLRHQLDMLEGRLTLPTISRLKRIK